MSFYPRLPPELQLKIWEFASMSPGVHHFKFEMPRIDPVQLRPIAVNDADPSAWRERRNLRSVHSMAWDGLHPVSMASQHTVYQDFRHRRRVHTEENGITAHVDGNTDLMLLKIRGDQFEMQSAAQIGSRAGLFAGLKRVALNFKLRKAEMRSIHRPFACLCHNLSHKAHPHCALALVDFLELLTHLEKFYFVFKLSGCDIVASFPEEPLSGENIVNNTSPVADRIRKVVEEIRGNIKRHGLEIFQDRKGTYYEVRREDTTHMLKEHTSLWKNVRVLCKTYRERAEKATRITYATREQRLKTEFKFLIFVETKYTLAPEGDGA
ncbi:hypothetical protein F5X99DRAFT_431282 [Biscogniauxia marginata]|nr:hypothetical protein F5X99DRAFT_431282 [Biscogniauxia marginata]